MPKIKYKEPMSLWLVEVNQRKEEDKEEDKFNKTLGGINSKLNLEWTV